MADSTLDSALFWLIDTWPGTPWQGADLPTDGFTGSSHHNVTTAVYPVGTKIQVLCTHTSYDRGLATFIYLRNSEVQHSTAPIKAKTFVVPANTTYWYDVTNSASGYAADKASSAAVGISTMDYTTGRYGWFWCGGVCPTQYVTDLDGAFVTDSTVVAGVAAIGNLGTTTTAAGGLCLVDVDGTVQALPIAVTLKSDD